MPYTLKTNQISVKDPETGEYSGVDILAEQTEQGLIAELQAEGTTQVNRINQAAVDVQAAVDQAETDAATIISDTQTSVNTLEAQKNTIAQTIASMAELGTDTTLSTPGMAADAGAVGDLSRQISDVDGALTSITGNAVIDMVYGKYIDLSGTSITMTNGYPTYESGVTSYSCGIFPCVAGDVFTISGTGGNATRLWGFVNSSGTILSVANASTTLSNYYLTAPENAAFLIIHDNSGKKSFFGKHIAFELSEQEKEFDDVVYSKTLTKTNGIYYKPDGTTGTNSSWGSIKARVSSVFSTGATIGTGTITTYSTTYPSIVYTDDNGTVVGTVFENRNVNGISANSIPNGATWVMFNSTNTFTVESKGLIDQISSKLINNLEGKKICVFGDSLAASGTGGTDTWIQRVANYFSCAEAYNRGVGGSFITSEDRDGNARVGYTYVNAEGDAYNRAMYSTPQTVPGYTEISPFMNGTARANTIPTDTDVVIILAGSNDISTTNETMFKAAYSQMLQNIMVRVPNAKIYTCTLVYHHAYDSNADLKAVYDRYRGYIKEISSNFGFPCIDLRSEMGCNDYNYTTYMNADGVHFNTNAGRDLTAECVAGNLKEYAVINS